MPNTTTRENDFWKLILSILLPPIGVAMEVGMSKHLAINIILTLFGWLPGVIHAMYIISTR